MRISTGLLALPLLFAVACDGDTSDTDVDTGTDTDMGSDTEVDTEIDTEADIDIAGSYTDNFGGSHVVSADSWVSGDSEFAIVEFDNDDEYALAQNDTDNLYNPDLYSRFDWSVNGDGNVVYCQAVFDGATLEDARAGSSDADDLDAGCGGFGWSVLTEVD